MRRFRIKTAQVLCLSLIVFTVWVGLIISLADVTTYVMRWDRQNEVVIQPRPTTIKAFINAIPTARDTLHIDREVPGPVEKGMPGRWKHYSGSRGMTHYKMSTAAVSKPTVKEGEMFSVVIQARDLAGRPRTTGGDFWYAILHQGSVRRTAGRLIDHGNGTYSVYFFAAWSGNSTVVITLLLPYEALDYMVNTVWHANDRIAWIGRFQNGDKKSIRRCLLRRGGRWENKCELTHPYALGKTVLLCDRPAYGLACDTLVAIYNNNTRIREKAREMVSNEYGALVKGKYYSQRLARLTVDIERASEPVVAGLQRRLRECEPDQPKPLTSGYWKENATWVSLDCRTRQWTEPDEIGECLRGKELYFMGASTSRQWFENLSAMLGVPFVRQNNLEQNNIYRRFENYNLTTIFKFHPLCLTGNPRPTPFQLFSFEVDVLDALKNADCNYVILISPWAHYPQWTKDMFLERVSLLKEGLLRFRARCPNAPIVVKGTHPRNQPGIEGKIFYNNFMLYELGKILRETFQGVGAWFQDIWDMNMAHPAGKVMHMPAEIVVQELNMFMSYVCRKIK